MKFVEEDTWFDEWGPLVVFFAVMLLFILSAGLTVFMLDRREQTVRDATVQRAYVCDSNDYTFYLEGNEVDLDKIRIENYSFDFDDENKTVILY